MGEPNTYAQAVEPYASALRMIREGVETLFGPVANLESEEAVLLRGPEPHHSAEAIIAALQRVAGAPPMTSDTVREIIARAIDHAEVAWCKGDDSRSAIDMPEEEKADAILEALTAAGYRIVKGLDPETLERAAKEAEARADHHRDYCESGCKCANGWHIAAAIRSLGETK